MGRAGLEWRDLNIRFWLMRRLWRPLVGAAPPARQACQCHWDGCTSMAHVTPSRGSNRACILRHCGQRKQTVLSKTSPWVENYPGRSSRLQASAYNWASSPEGNPPHLLQVRGLGDLGIKEWLMILSSNGRKPGWLLNWGKEMGARKDIEETRAAVLKLQMPPNHLQGLLKPNCRAPPPESPPWVCDGAWVFAFLISPHKLQLLLALNPHLGKHSARACLLQLWSLDQWRQDHLEACWKCTISGPPHTYHSEATAKQILQVVRAHIKVC